MAIGESMDVKGRGSNNKNNLMSSDEDDMDLRRGPWTVDEDLTLMNYIATHGEGRWNTLANSAGKYYWFPKLASSLYLLM